MDFSQSRLFQEIITKEYGEFYSKYPHALLTIDFLIQLRVLREHKFEKWTNDSKKKHIEADARERIVRGRYFPELYYRFLMIFSYFFPTKDNFSVHLSIEENLFPGLKPLLIKIIDQKGWSLINQATFSLGDLFSVLSLKKISPYKCFLSYKTKKEIKKFISDDDQTLKILLNDESFMTNLDSLVKNDTVRTRKLIEALGINLFINTGDCEAYARVLNYVCTDLTSKTISIAHGYISNSVLMGISPVRSNILILWTEKQRSDISIVVSESTSKKLRFIGFPKFYEAQKQTVSDQNECLIAMSHLNHLVNDPKFSSDLKHLIQELKRLFKKVRVRLHPYERNGFENIYSFFDGLDIELSDLNLAEDIKRSSFVIGASTSVLVEASAAGKKVFEIQEFTHPGVSLEGVTSINLAETPELIERGKKIKLEDSLKWDEGKLENNLKNLFKEMF